MVLQLFAIYDRVAQKYGQILLHSNDGEARRSLALALRAGASSPLSESAKDFALYRLGEYDLETGKITAGVVPVIVCDVADLLPKKGEGALIDEV